MRPDLKVITFRGNVQSRLHKLAEGEVDATLLALAGLNRLGNAYVAASIIETDEMLPAVAQGAIGITCRKGDERSHKYLKEINHQTTVLRVTAERALLEVLDGSCRTPIAALAEIDSQGGLSLRGLIAKPDGSEVLKSTRSGDITDAEALGWDAGQELKRRAGPAFLE